MLAPNPPPPSGDPPGGATVGATGAASPATGAAQAGLVIALLVPLALWAGARASPLPLLVAMGSFAAIALTVADRVAASHPHPRFGPANVVTLIRGAGVSTLLGLAAAGGPHEGTGAWTPALGAAVLLALDGLDGRIARHTRLASAFGARFDMEVDALLILTLCLLAVTSGLVGGWLILLGLMRYGFVALGRLAPRFARPLPPSMRRRAVCGGAILLLALLLAPPLAPLAPTLGAVALGLVGGSFAMDLAWLARAPR